MQRSKGSQGAAGGAKGHEFAWWMAIRRELGWKNRARPAYDDAGLVFDVTNHATRARCAIRPVATSDVKFRNRPRRVGWQKPCLVVLVAATASCGGTVPATRADPRPIPLGAAACAEAFAEAGATVAPLEVEDGVWSIEILDCSRIEAWPPPGSDPSRASEPPTTVGSYRVVFQPAGAPAVAEDTVRDFHLTIEDDLYDVTVVRLDQAYDFDADGREELLLATGRAVHEEFGELRYEVLTPRSSGVEPYVPADVAEPIHEVRDVDGDGAPDLLSRFPYFGSSPWGPSEVPTGGPFRIFHAHEGAFRDDDEVARAFVSDACAPHLELTFPASPDEFGYDHAMRTVSCACIRGDRAAGVEAAITRWRGSDTCMDAGWSTCASLADALVEHLQSLTGAGVRGRCVP